MVPVVGGVGVEPWSSAPLAPPAPLDFDAVIDDQDAFVEALTRLRGSGWTQLDGVPSGTEAVEAFASRIGYVRRTIFGGVWELAADLTDHADTAYGTTALGPHTDGTYSHDGPGLQLFACQDRRGDGGESILVDGFAAAELFAAHGPDGARLLASLDVPCRYVEPGVSLRAERPVLRCDQAGRLVQMSINAYDREPFLLADAQEWDRFADAYDGLQRGAGRRVPMAAPRLAAGSATRVRQLAGAPRPRFVHGVSTVPRLLPEPRGPREFLAAPRHRGLSGRAVDDPA